MSLVFSGITPHSPLLLEGVARDKSKKINKTKQALAQMEQDIYLSFPDTIIIISPYCSKFKNAFTIAAYPEMKSNFKKLGNLKLEDTWNTDYVLANTINQQVSNPTQTIGAKKLEASSSIPLHILADKLDHTRILPIGYTDLSVQQHYKFGQELGKIIKETKKRVVVLASGDMSHTLSKQAPAGFHDDGGVYDNRIKKYLTNQQVDSILKMDQDMVENAQDYLYQSLVILLGIIGNSNYRFHKYSYQEVLGVGHLSANLRLE